MENSHRWYTFHADFWYIFKSGLTPRADAIKIANDYMVKYYSSDKKLKDISVPSSISYFRNGWIIYYEDKDFLRLPAGVEVFVDGVTGEAYRLNQE